MLKILSVTILAVLLTSGCTSPPAGDYFPLTAGHTWSYQITQGDRVVNVMHESLPAEELFGRTVYPRAISLRDTRMEIDYFVSDESGVYLFATLDRGQSDAVANPNPTFSYANPVAKGTSWEEIYESVIFGDATPVPLNNVIDGTDFNVTVPAGTFANTMRVTGTGEINTAKGKLLATVTQWYAPDVGLIKYAMAESTDNTSISGANLTVVLMESTIVETAAD